MRMGICPKRASRAWEPRYDVSVCPSVLAESGGGRGRLCKGGKERSINETSVCFGEKETGMGAANGVSLGKKILFHVFELKTKFDKIKF